MEDFHKLLTNYFFVVNEKSDLVNKVSCLKENQLLLIKEKESFENETIKREVASSKGENNEMIKHLDVLKHNNQNLKSNLRTSTSLKEENALLKRKISFSTKDLAKCVKGK